RNPATKEIDPWAAAIIAKLASYAEVSPSRTGVKVLVLGAVPPGRKRQGNIEMYSHGRYFTLTGRKIADASSEVSGRQKEVDRLHGQLFPAPKNSLPTSKSNNLDDDEIIRRAKIAKNGKKFRRLWAGDTSDYASPSEADLALCRLLAFWTGPDHGRIDRLFRQSGLIRDKWDEMHGMHTYGQLTIAKALDCMTEFYKSDGDGDAKLRTAAEHREDDRPRIVITTEEHKVNEQAATALGRDTSQPGSSKLATKEQEDLMVLRGASEPLREGSR